VRILVVTPEWPSPDAPQRVPFMVEHVNRLRRSGHSVEVFAFRGRKNPLRYLAARLSLRRYLTRERFDLLHTHWGQSGLVSLYQGPPVVLTLRGSDLQGIVGRRFGGAAVLGAILKQVTRLVAPRADAAIVVSAHLARLLPGGIRTWVIPSGIELDVFHPLDQNQARSSLGLPRTKRLVLFASDPRRAEKRYALAKAAVELAGRPDDVELVVTANEPHSSMPLYLSACDVLLLTSTHEGSPNVVKEALACGLPVVSTDVGDVMEQFGRLDCCLVAPDDSAASLAARLVTLLDSRPRDSGRSAVAAFSGDNEVRRLNELYVGVLRRGRRP
jgi:glycosyltransferase involved in cell wall biosynthesis